MRRIKIGLHRDRIAFSLDGAKEFYEKTLIEAHGMDNQELLLKGFIELWKLTDEEVIQLARDCSYFRVTEILNWAEPHAVRDWLKAQREHKAQQ